MSVGLDIVIANIILCTLISYALGPYINLIGIKYNIVDIPNLRKVHKKPIVRIGGLSIFIAFYLYFFLTLFFIKDYNFDTYITTKFYIFLIGAFLYFLIGIHDDIYKSSPLFRLFLQFSVAFWVSFSGINFGSLNFALPYLGQINIALNPITNYIISATWIVGITNAINWIDGIDALAGGYSAIISLGLCILMILKGDTSGVLFYSIFLGSIIGFLMRNFKPAFYIMGDCGSNFLGFSLAASALLFLSNSTYEYLNIFNILLIFSLPIGDMLIVIFERLINNQNIFLPNKKHIHHKLMNCKLDYKLIIFILFFYSSVTTLVGIFNINKNSFL